MSAFGGVSDCCSKTMGSKDSVRFIHYLAKNWDIWKLIVDRVAGRSYVCPVLSNGLIVCCWR